MQFSRSTIRHALCILLLSGDRVTVCPLPTRDRHGNWQMKIEKCAAPRVFADNPTRVSSPAYGASTTERPCTIFTAWQADLQHFPSQMGDLAVRWTRNGKRPFAAWASRRSDFAARTVFRYRTWRL